MDSGRRINNRGWVLLAAVVGLAVVVVSLGLTGLIQPGDDQPTVSPESSVAPPNPTRTSAPSTPEPAQAPPAPLVLAISVDGLNPDALALLGPREIPSLHRLVREGASTLNARSAEELTITLPNHTGMLTGRGVSGPSGHGVTFNDDVGGTVASRHGSYVPGAFDVAHDHGLGTAFFAEKDKFDFLMRSWDGDNGAPDITGADDGRDKTDVDRVAGADSLVSGVGKTLLDSEASLVFLHLAAPDKAGHADGWLGASYLQAVRSVDRQLATILKLIDSNPEVADRITILLTADHGGSRGMTSHDDATRRANYTVPFIAWGRGVLPGADLYGLNAGRADPGEGRPDYDGPQPVRNIDIANTALSLLQLPPVSGAMSSDWPTLTLR